MTTCDSAVRADAHPAGKEEAGRIVCRIAKLRGTAGEAPCILSRLSPHAVHLRTLHDHRFEPRMELETVNGQRHAITRIAHDGRQARFAFVCPLDVAGFLADRAPFARRGIRLDLGCPVRLVTAGCAVPAVLLDLSREGAGVRSPIWLTPGQRVRLVGEGLCDRVGPDLSGTVRRVEGARSGIVLDRAMTLEALALRVRLLQACDRSEARGFAAVNAPPGSALH
ncbi:PilZ domain-containing protein [Novosphingobium sp. 1949]|uniref:PilZ domain-containing protein n=1 Tax=Novosphingobium organovorum TaxID=2930092 RepID=A0ABT0BCI3_9SPHN|nr:PilZ domain-containing protein [Novosphingobium organovorum]MCJ2182568.1 PilZ domain-containing protein [Novosphingobium organovorum]